MRVLIVTLVVALAIPATCRAQDRTPAEQFLPALVPGPVLLAMSVSQSSVGLAATQQISPSWSVLIGDAGEYTLQNRSLRKYLVRGGRWEPFLARRGRQGNDQIWVKRSANAVITDVIICEVKTTSDAWEKVRLSAPQRGRQMSTKWIQAGLDDLQRYVTKLDPQTIPTKKLSPGISRGTYKVPLSNENTVAFWVDATDNRLKYDGPPSHLDEALGKIRSDAATVQKRVATGGFRSRIFVLETGNPNAIRLVSITPGEIPPAATGSLTLGKVARQHQIIVLSADELSAYRAGRRTAIVDRLQSRFPELTFDDVKRLAAEVDPVYQRTEQLRSAIIQRHAIVGLAGMGIVGALELAAQVSAGNGVDISRVSRASALGAVSTVTASYAELRVNQMALRSASQSLGWTGSRVLDASYSASSGGLLVGGLVYAYGGMVMGLHDFNDANLIAVSSAGGAIASWGAHQGLYLLANVIGSAMNGTSIATLHGAAFNSAATAWIGGNAGMASVAGGQFVLGVVSIGAAFVVSAAIMTTYDEYTKHEMRRRQEKLLDRVLTDDDFSLTLARQTH